MKKIALTSLVAVLTLGGCATKQVTRAALPDTKRLCIIENPRVKFDFLGAYRKALEERGFEVVVYPETRDVTACPVTTMYTAHWRWDLALYLAYAEMQVYSGGQRAGRAVFNARNSRFINAESTVKEMVDELFPKR